MNDPIFVRGFSRSGGTLMVTILDAHPDIAMSYELYPSLLEIDDRIDVEAIILTLKKEKDMKAVLKKVPRDSGMYTFIVRCDRGGLRTHELSELIRDHYDQGFDLSTNGDRLRLIASCCKKKMIKEKKQRWGLKCSNHYDEYLALWPDAYFLNMVRDGRDVLASQMNTGAFNKTPEQIGRGWHNTLQKFHRLVEDERVNAYEVIYEQLVTNPESEVKKICDFLQVDFSDQMLTFYRKDLTIYQSSHLSMERISKPIDTSKIGRWKHDLSETMLNEFYEVAKDSMVQFGYLKGE